MKRLLLFLVGAVLVDMPNSASAADPAWWASRGVLGTSPSSNLSPATIGQAKWLVSRALAELQPRLAAGDYQALQTNVATVVNLTLPQTQADFDNQRKVLLVGQLKAMAKPFYDRLRVLSASWVDAQMDQSGIRQIEPGSFPLSFSPYPWSAFSRDDSNYSPATLGQLKAVFSLRFESWGTAAVDTDGDGISDVAEAAAGTSPVLVDSDFDGYNDAIDAFPLDPTRHDPPVSVPGDTSKPLVALETPANAIYVSGP